MYKGPDHNNVMDMVGPMFSAAEFLGSVVGTGGARPNPIGVKLSYNVGLGNGFYLYMRTDLPDPAAATDVKWIDVSLDYFFSSRSRLPLSTAVDFADDIYLSPTDIISERDPRNVGAQILKHRWQVHRLPITNDTENQHPFGDDPVNPRYPVIFDLATADNLTLSMKFIALDENVAAVPQDGTTTSFAIAKGGHARSR